MRSALWKPSRGAGLVAGGALAAVAMVLAASRGPAQPAGISGTVRREAGGPGVAGATVAFLGMATRTDASGGFTLGPALSGTDTPSAGVYALAATLADEVCVQCVEGTAGGRYELLLEEVAPEGVDAYCARCHRPEPASGGAGRSMASHWFGLDLQRFWTAASSRTLLRYRRPTRLPLVDSRYATCDSCHTRHVPTAQRAYVRLSLGPTNDLCHECHL